MTNSHPTDALEAPDDELAALFASERALPPVDPRVAAHIAQGVTLAVGVGAAATIGAGAAQGAPSAAVSSTAATAAPPALALTATKIVSSLALVVGLSGAAGYIAGYRRGERAARAHASQVEPAHREPVVEIAAVAPRADSEMPVAPVARAVTTTVTTHVARRTTVVVDASVAAATDAPPSRLEEEQRLLDAARSAYARGRVADAEASLNEHARRFPSGEFAEDREVLRIEVLRLDHRDAEAVALAREFLREHPHSLYARRLQRIVQVPSSPSTPAP